MRRGSLRSLAALAALVALATGGVPVRADDAAMGLDPRQGAAVSTTIAAPAVAPAHPPATGLVLPVAPLLAYPATPRESLVERLFGQDVADPYRWLERNIRTSPDVAAWVAGQNATSARYLAGLPGRDALAARLRTLMGDERFGLPRKAGRRYFYLHNHGGQNLPTLDVRETLAGPGRVLIDPNAWGGDGAAALDQWAPSRSGRWLAYTEQVAGSDWRTIRVADVATGRVLDERLQWANDTLIGWVGDEGILYSRFPAPDAGHEHLAPAFDKAVWFHRVGTPQGADVLVFATPDKREWGHKAAVTSDGRWAVITSEASTLPVRTVHLIDLARRGPDRWRALPLVETMTSDWKLVDGMGDRLWFVTNDGAPRYRLVQIDLGARPAVRVIVPERPDTLEGGRIVGNRLILSYLRDGQGVAVVTDLKGRPASAITLNAIGTASGFGGRPGDPETFYQFSSFTQPPAIFRMDMRSGAVIPFAKPAQVVDPADYVAELRTYRSKDGTTVPIYIVRKRALVGRAAPTLLYGYGGFDIATVPAWSAQRMAWLEAGGVFALAQVRGGGEFGRAWYDAGRLERKQNSFDDFIAAGEFLIREGIAAPGGLAAQGGSNGGMMVAAVINQRPDLFAAANPDVGVMDMLRFDRFTQGRFWTQDYGDPAREADWKVLRAYSPYHNIRAADYPAILVTTADTDDRVVPAHSFKYVAALQAAPTGPRPHLLRVESGAGHGSGKPLDKAVAGGADVLAFLAFWTGLKLP